MAGNSRDVSLLIKARDESSKVIEHVASALRELIDSQGDLGSGAAANQSKLVGFTNALLSIDKAAGTLQTQVDQGSRGLDALGNRATANAEKFDALTREAQSLAKVVDLLATESSKAFIGPRRNGLADALKAARTDLRGLNSEIGALGANITRDLENTGAARSSLQQLASLENALADASATAQAQIVLETAALKEQAEAAQRVSAIQARINRVTGVDRPNATGTAAAAADTLVQGVAAREAAEFRDAAIAHDLFNERVREGAQALAREEAALERINLRDADIAFRQFNARAKEGLRTFEETEAAAEAEAAAIRKLREELDPVATVTAVGAAEMQKLNRWLREGKISATEFALAEKAVAAQVKSATDNLKAQSTNAPKVSLFGLRPYETQNLLFQFNDIATQLASGTSLSQTLAQQGGQIFQLFQNRVGPAIIATFSNPFFLGAAGVVTAFALGVNRAADEVERLRTLSAALAANADGGLYDPKALNASARALDLYGISAKDALTSVRAFVKEGVDPTQITAFGRTAKDLADVLGIDLKDAVNQVGEAFTGSFAAVDKLDRSLNFLTASQREHIKSLFEEGRASEARSAAFRIFSDRQSEAAEKSRGEWAASVRTLQSAYDLLITTISKSPPTTGLLGFFEKFAQGANYILEKIDGVRSIATILNDIVVQNNNLELLKANNQLGTSNAQIAEVEKRLAGLRTELAGAQAKYYGLAGANAPVANDTRAAGSEAEKKANAEVRDATNDLLAKNKGITAEKRIQAAIDKARGDALRDLGKDEFKNASDAVQQAYIAAKVAEARRATEKQITDEKKQQRAAEESAIKGFSAKVIGPESGGKADAQNPQSSALGVGQFLRSTFISLFRSTYPQLAQSLSDDAIAALRKNVTISKNLIEVYARDNAAVLKKAGVAITEANLYAAHFLGSGGAKKLLTANPNTPTNQLFKGEVLTANQGYFRKDKGKGAYRTAGELQAFLGQKIGDSSTAEAAGAVAVQKAIDEAADAQEKFNAKVADENEKRQQNIDSLVAQTGLIGNAALAEQRRAAIAEALLAKQQELDKINADLRAKGLQEIEFTNEQRQAVERLTGAQFDLAHAKEAATNDRNAVDQPVADLTAQRAALQDQIKFFNQKGQTGLAEQLGPQLDNVNERLSAAIEKAKGFYAAMAGDGDAAAAARASLGLTREQVDNITLGLTSAQTATQSLGYFMGVSLDDAAQKFANGAASAFDSFAQAIAQGRSAIGSLKDAFLAFAADFLRQIAQMIQQQIIFNLVSGLLKSIAGTGIGAGVGGGTANGIGAVGGLQAHSGGIIGGAGPVSRAVLPQWFAGAQRLHTGGIAGLKPNEVPTILERGEEVLDRDNPRHAANGGGAGANVKIVNAIDAGDLMSNA